MLTQTFPGVEEIPDVADDPLILQHQLDQFLKDAGNHDRGGTDDHRTPRRRRAKAQCGPRKTSQCSRQDQRAKPQAKAQIKRQHPEQIM